MMMLLIHPPNTSQLMGIVSNQNQHMRLLPEQHFNHLVSIYLHPATKKIKMFCIWNALMLINLVGVKAHLSVVFAVEHTKWTGFSN